MRIFLSLFGDRALRPHAPTVAVGDVPGAAQDTERRDAQAARRRLLDPGPAPSFAPAPIAPPPSRVRAWVFGSNTPCDLERLNDTDIVTPPRTAAVHAAIIERLWKQDPNFVERLPDYNLMHLCAAFPHVCAALQALDGRLQARLQTLQARAGLAAAPIGPERDSDDDFSESEDTMASSGCDDATVPQTSMLLREHLVRCPYPQAQMDSMRALTQLAGTDAAADIEPFLFSRHPGVADLARTLMLSLGHQRACALARLWHGHERHRIDGMWLALFDSDQAEPRKQITTLLALHALVEPAREVRKELLSALLRLGSQQAFDVASWYALEADAGLARHANAVLRRLALDVAPADA